MQTPDWEVTDTREMPSRLLDEIYTFVEWERNGWPDPDAEEEDSEGN